MASSMELQLGTTRLLRRKTRPISVENTFLPSCGINLRRHSSSSSSSSSSSPSPSTSHTVTSEDVPRSPSSNSGLSKEEEEVGVAKGIDLSSRRPPAHLTAGSTTPAPLSILPLSSIVRSYFVTAISSTPLLLTPSLGILNFLATAKSPLFNADLNPVLRHVLKKTFYAQFCAGETPAEVRGSVVALKRLGYSGVILGYGREVVMDEDEAGKLGSTTTGGGGDSVVEEEEKSKSMDEIEQWRRGTSKTVRLAEDGDFVALKFTGAGREALRLLTRNKGMSETLEEAVVGFCELARKRGVMLLFDAEQAVVQDGIDNWTVEMMKRYNTGGRALVYGTYQAYRKSTPETLARHLDEARKGGFTLGVKLVRGAYLGSDPREMFWDTKEETDRVYDEIAGSVMRRKYGAVLRDVDSGIGDFPKVDLVLASHNRKTVQKAREIRDNQASIGEERIGLAYGQLMGMADEISCELVQAGNQAEDKKMMRPIDVPKAYKYLVWGTVGECTKYLLRRAQENKDAVSRTRDGRVAMGKELRRRLGLGMWSR